jgi:hypothetical protein
MEMSVNEMQKLKKILQEAKILIIKQGYLLLEVLETQKPWATQKPVQQ